MFLRGAVSTYLEDMWKAILPFRAFLTTRSSCGQSVSYLVVLSQQTTYIFPTKLMKLIVNHHYEASHSSHAHFAKRLHWSNDVYLQIKSLELFIDVKKLLIDRVQNRPIIFKVRTTELHHGMQSTLAELSSPFVNIHSFLNTLDSRLDLQIANGLLFIAMVCMQHAVRFSRGFTSRLWFSGVMDSAKMCRSRLRRSWTTYSPSERSLIPEHQVPRWLCSRDFNRQMQLFTSLSAFPFTTIDCLKYNDNYTKTPDTSEKMKLWLRIAIVIVAVNVYTWLCSRDLCIHYSRTYLYIAVDLAFPSIPYLSLLYIILLSCSRRRL